MFAWTTPPFFLNIQVKGLHKGWDCKDDLKHSLNMTIPKLHSVFCFKDSLFQTFLMISKRKKQASVP